MQLARCRNFHRRPFATARSSSRWVDKTSDAIFKASTLRVIFNRSLEEHNLPKVPRLDRLQSARRRQRRTEQPSKVDIKNSPERNDNMHLYICCTLLFTQCIEINWEARLRFGLEMDITFMSCMKSWYNFLGRQRIRELTSEFLAKTLEHDYKRCKCSAQASRRQCLLPHPILKL